MSNVAELGICPPHVPDASDLTKLDDRVFYHLTITVNDNMIRDLFLGFIRLHLLYHASEAPVFGLDMIRELSRHGYELSPGTLYPILHKLAEAGYLEQEIQVVGGKQRKYYRATPAGRAALAEAMVKVRELVDEVGLDTSS
jgi:PadR family transcriptional regulator, regulatory protein PadR